MQKSEISALRRYQKWGKIMSKLTLQVINKNGSVIAESTGEDFTDLVVMHTYEEGDYIMLRSEKSVTSKVLLMMQ